MPMPSCGGVVVWKSRPTITTWPCIFLERQIFPAFAAWAPQKKVHDNQLEFERDCYCKGEVFFQMWRKYYLPTQLKKETWRILIWIKFPSRDRWETETDTLRVIVSQTPTEKNDDSRRGCLSTLSLTFDPLGMISPVLLSAKRVMQKTWQLKLHWDETIPEELLKGRKKWKIELVHHNWIEAHRCYF